MSKMLLSVKIINILSPLSQLNSKWKVRVRAPKVAQCTITNSNCEKVKISATSYMSVSNFICVTGSEPEIFISMRDYFWICGACRSQGDRSIYSRMITFRSWMGSAPVLSVGQPALNCCSFEKPRVFLRVRCSVQTHGWHLFGVRHCLQGRLCLLLKLLHYHAKRWPSRRHRRMHTQTRMRMHRSRHTDTHTHTQTRVCACTYANTLTNTLTQTHTLTSHAHFPTQMLCLNDDAWEAQHSLSDYNTPKYININKHSNSDKKNCTVGG